MIMKKEMYVHFHADEHRFVDQAQEWIDRAAHHHLVKRTDFLDPRQKFILDSLVHRSTGVQIRFDGGYEHAERMRAIIAPDDGSIEDQDSLIGVLAVELRDRKLVTLEHRDYLGAILGLGMKRDKIGDLHLLENGCHYLVTVEAGQYLHTHLSQIHKHHVYTELTTVDQLQWTPSTYEDMMISVASMRLDSIVSDVLHLSRAKALIPIQAKRCRVNWRVIEDPSYFVKIDDLISVQGFGRFKVLDVEGLSKKGRTRVKVGKLV